MDDRINIYLYFTKYRQKTEHKNRENDTHAQTVRYRQIKTYDHKTTALKLETETTAAIW